MIKYESKTKEEMQMISQYHKIIQGFISLVANRKCGCLDPDQVQGILKCEGGVRVNGCEICIKEDYIMDDWKRPNDPSTEEIAVADVIRDMLSSIDFTSSEQATSSFRKYMMSALSTDDLATITKFTQSPFAGDNLLSFFKVMW